MEADHYDSDTSVETESDRDNAMVVEEEAVGDAQIASASFESTHPSTSTQEESLKKQDSQEETNDTDDDDDADNGSTCPICLDIWSNTGKHRLASLRCGHLFGHSCIIRWLQVGCPATQRRCPQCNKRANIKDIRLHYARKLQVLDTAERDRLREELENVQREKNRLELELSRANLSKQMHLNQIADLQQKLTQIQNEGCSCQTKQTKVLKEKRPSKLSMVKNIDICKDGGCRVLAYNEKLKFLAVSQISSNVLFPGFGIKKIDATEFRPTLYISAHSKLIRDMAFHPHRDDMLLSVSLDRCAKIIDMSSNRVVQSYNTEMPLWSCCWDANSDMFFTGTCNGVVFQYDSRSTTVPLKKITSLDDSSPVVSLAAIPSSPGRTLTRGGLILCKLNSCWAYELHDAEYVGLQLPFDGPFVSTYHDRNTDLLLISTRPSSRYPNARHIVCELPQSVAGESSSLLCRPVHILQGSASQNLLSRSCLVPIQGDTLVAAHHESLKSIAMWSVSSGSQVINSPVFQPVIDLCPVEVNGNQHLATLSEKSLKIYNIR